MANVRSEGNTGRRGRPALIEGRELSDDIMMAVEKGLRQKSHLDLTTREIASAAGTYPAMIHYYYQGKNGLLDAILDDMCIHIAESLDNLNKLFKADCQDATRKIVQIWLELMNHHKGGASIVLIESFRPYSPVWQYYRGRKSRGSFGRMQDIVRTLIDAEYYKADVDPELAAFTIFSVVHSPVFIGQIMSEIGHPVGHLLDNWYEQSVEMLDRQYRRY